MTRLVKMSRVLHSFRKDESCDSFRKNESCDSFRMEWLRLVGSIKLQVSFAKEPYERDDILQKKLKILSILLTVATP